MIISAIEPQKRSKQRRSVFIDGQFAFGLHIETLARLGLKVGQDVNREQLAAIVFEEDKHKAKEAILNLLARRDRSRRELVDRLTLKGFPAPVIEAAVKDLAGVGLIDDPRFARLWTRFRALEGHRGARLIRYELLRRGISRADVEKALTAEPIDERALARAVVSKYAPRYKTLKPHERRSKLYGILMRRGFAPDVVHDVLEIADEPEPDDAA